MSDSVNGTVAIKSVKGEGTEKRRYGLKVEGDWYNAFGSTDVSEGDEVKIEYSTNDYGNQIEDIEVVGSGSEQSSGEAEDSDMDGQGMAEGVATDSHIPKNRSILAQKALEEARKLHQSEHDNSDFESRGAYMEQLTSTADGFFNWMLDKSEVDEQ